MIAQVNFSSRFQVRELLLVRRRLKPRWDKKDKFTDEATVAEAFGLKVQLVEGEENNFINTRPVDLVVAEHLSSSN